MTWEKEHPPPKGYGQLSNPRPKASFIPLRIAQIPVVRPPYVCGALPYIHTGFSDPPADPMPEHVLDPHRYLQPTVMAEMLRHLPVEVYYVAFLTNGDLVVLLSELMDRGVLLRYPHTRAVSYSSSQIPMHHMVGTEGDQDPSRAPSDLCFQPGEILYWKGKNYK